MPKNHRRYSYGSTTSYTSDTDSSISHTSGKRSSFADNGVEHGSTVKQKKKYTLILILAGFIILAAIGGAITACATKCCGACGSSSSGDGSGKSGSGKNGGKSGKSDGKSDGVDGQQGGNGSSGGSGKGARSPVKPQSKDTGKKDQEDKPAPGPDTDKAGVKPGKTPENMAEMTSDGGAPTGVKPGKTPENDAEMTADTGAGRKQEKPADTETGKPDKKPAGNEESKAQKRPQEQGTHKQGSKPEEQEAHKQGSKPEEQGTHKQGSKPEEQEAHKAGKKPKKPVQAAKKPKKPDPQGTSTDKDEVGADENKKSKQKQKDKKEATEAESTGTPPPAGADAKEPTKPAKKPTGTTTKPADEEDKEDVQDKETESEKPKETKKQKYVYDKSKIIRRTTTTAIHDIKKIQQEDGPNGLMYLLFSHGSYNPVHYDHIQMMQSTREMLLQKHKDDEVKVTVLAFLGLTHQDWLQKPPPKGKGMDASERFEDEERKEMLHLAMEEHDWIYYAPEGSQQPREAHYHSTLEMMRMIWNKFQQDVAKASAIDGQKMDLDRLRFLQVVGSDTAQSFFPGEDILSTGKRGYIIIARDQESAKQNKMLGKPGGNKSAGAGKTSKKSGDKFTPWEVDPSTPHKRTFWIAGKKAELSNLETKFVPKKNIIVDATAGHSSTMVRHALKVCVDPSITEHDKLTAQAYLKEAINPKVLAYIKYHHKDVLGKKLAGMEEGAFDMPEE